MDLTGKVAIVTGATRGIGRAIALGLAGAGCNIVVTGRTETPRLQLPVNNAGISSYAPFLETSLDAWERVFAANVRGTFLCCQAILPSMVQRSQGSIINISSLAADFVRTGGHGDTEDARFIGQPYGASKAAVERLSRGLAGEKHRRQRPQARQTRPHRGLQTAKAQC